MNLLKPERQIFLLKGNTCKSSVILECGFITINPLINMINSLLTTHYGILFIAKMEK